MSSTIGVLLPDNNHVLKRDFERLGTQIEVFRLPVAGTGPDELVAMASHALAGADHLRALGVSMLLYACMSTSFLPPFEWDAEFASIAGALPATTAARAMTDALTNAGARRVTVVSAYTGTILEHMRSYMALAGLEVVSNASLELSELHEFEHVTAEELVTLAQSHVTPQTDAICIAGTDIAAMDAAKSLQDELGLPVVATNRALFDAAMRMEARR